MKTLVFVLLALSCSAFAVEPVNPEGVCDRFLLPADQATCLKRAQTMDLDWYAAGVCQKVDDDDQFNRCWDQIAGKSFEPKHLERCSGELEDDVRIACITGVAMKGPAVDSSKRLPASSKPGRKPAEKPVYQPLKIGK